MGKDSEYLTSAAINFVDRMRDIEAQRIQRTELNKRAAMSLIRHVGKIMSSLPDAIRQTLNTVTFNPEAPPMRFLPEDEAEYEEDEDQEAGETQPQGLPSSGTPPGTPPSGIRERDLLPPSVKEGFRKLFKELKDHKLPIYLLQSGRVGRRRLDQPSQMWNSPECHR